MPHSIQPMVTGPGQRVIDELLADVTAAVPRLLAGAVFLVLAYVAGRLVLRVVRAAADRAYPAEEGLVADLVVTVAAIFLWFTVALALLKIVGLGDIAASLGTATGFVALGVAFALKEMIADTVAGVYLLRDPDFHPGDRVDAASVAGTVSAIDLRKTRIDLDDGDRVIVANRDVEKKWTVRGDGPEGDASA